MTILGYKLQKPRVAEANSPETAPANTRISNQGAFDAEYPPADDTRTHGRQYAVRVGSSDVPAPPAPDRLIPDGGLLPAVGLEWTRDDPTRTRIGWDGALGRWDFLPGSGLTVLLADVGASLPAGATYLDVDLVPAPQTDLLISTPSTVRISVGATAKIVVLQASPGPGIPPAGTAYVYTDTNQVRLNPSDCILGQPLNWQGNRFFGSNDSTGRCGTVGDPVYLHPTPISGEEALVSLGLRPWLTRVVGVPGPGEFGVAASGLLTFNAADVAAHRGEPVLYQGVRLGTSIAAPRGTVGTLGAPGALPLLDEDIEVLLWATEPGPGTGSITFKRARRVTTAPLPADLTAGDVVVVTGTGQVVIPASDSAGRGSWVLHYCAGAFVIESGVDVLLYRNIADRTHSDPLTLDAKAETTIPRDEPWQTTVGRPPVLRLPMPVYLDPAYIPQLTLDAGTGHPVPTPLVLGTDYVLDETGREATWTSDESVGVALLRDSPSFVLPHQNVFTLGATFSVVRRPGLPPETLTLGTEALFDPQAGRVDLVRQETGLVLADRVWSPLRVAADPLLVKLASPCGRMSLVTRPRVRRVPDIIRVGTPDSAVEIVAGVAGSGSTLTAVAVDTLADSSSGALDAVGIGDLVVVEGGSNSGEYLITGVIPAGGGLARRVQVAPPLPDFPVAEDLFYCVVSGTLIAGQASVSARTGVVYLSAADVASYPDEPAYAVSTLVPGTDYGLGLTMGQLSLALPLAPWDRLWARYRPLNAALPFEEWVGFPILTELGAPTVDPYEATFNPSGRSVRGVVRVRRSGRPVDASAYTVVGTTVRFNDIPAGTSVRIDYDVYDAVGTETTAQLLGGVTDTALILAPGDTSFSVAGNVTADYPASSLILVDGDPYTVSGSSFGGGTTTVTLSLPIRRDHRATQAAGTRLVVTIAVTTYPVLDAPANARSLEFVGAPNVEPGHVVFLSGSPGEAHVVLSVKSAEGSVVVNLAAGLSRPVSGETVRLTALPVFPVGALTLRTWREAAQPPTLYRSTGGPPVTLVAGVDYRMEGDVITLTTPLRWGDVVTLDILSLRRYPAGAVLSASYLRPITPDEAGIVGLRVSASFAYRNPDTWFFRVIHRADMFDEVAAEFEAEAVAQAPSSGMAVRSPVFDVATAGRGSIVWDIGHADDRDEVAGTIAGLQDALIDPLESVVSDLDARVIGDLDARYDEVADVLADVQESSAPVVLAPAVDPEALRTDTVTINGVPWYLNHMGTFLEAWQSGQRGRFFPSRMWKEGLAAPAPNDGDFLFGLDIPTAHDVTATMVKAHAIITEIADSTHVVVDQPNGDPTTNRPALAVLMMVSIGRPGKTLQTLNKINVIAGNVITLNVALPGTVREGDTLWDETETGTYRDGESFTVEAGTGIVRQYNAVPFSGLPGGAFTEFTFAATWPDADPRMVPALSGLGLDDGGALSVPRVILDGPWVGGSPSWTVEPLLIVESGAITNVVANTAAGLWGKTATVTTGLVLAEAGRDLGAEGATPGDLVVLPPAANGGLGSMALATLVSANLYVGFAAPGPVPSYDLTIQVSQGTVAAAIVFNMIVAPDAAVGAGDLLLVESGPDVGTYIIGGTIGLTVVLNPINPFPVFPVPGNVNCRLILRRATGVVTSPTHLVDPGVFNFGTAPVPTTLTIPTLGTFLVVGGGNTLALWGLYPSGPNKKWFTDGGTVVRADLLTPTTPTTATLPGDHTAEYLAGRQIGTGSGPNFGRYLVAGSVYAAGPGLTTVTLSGLVPPEGLRDLRVATLSQLLAPRRGSPEMAVWEDALLGECSVLLNNRRVEVRGECSVNGVALTDSSANFPLDSVLPGMLVMVPERGEDRALRRVSVVALHTLTLESAVPFPATKRLRYRVTNQRVDAVKEALDDALTAIVDMRSDGGGPTTGVVQAGRTRIVIPVELASVMEGDILWDPSGSHGAVYALVAGDVVVGGGTTTIDVAAGQFPYTGTTDLEIWRPWGVFPGSATLAACWLYDALVPFCDEALPWYDRVNEDPLDPVDVAEGDVPDADALARRAEVQGVIAIQGDVETTIVGILDGEGKARDGRWRWLVTRLRAGTGTRQVLVRLISERARREEEAAAAARKAREAQSL